MLIGQTNWAHEEGNVKEVGAAGFRQSKYEINKTFLTVNHERYSSRADTRRVD